MGQSEKPENRKILAVVFFTVFMDLVGFGMIIPLIPYLGKEYQASGTQIGLLMSLFSLMQFIFSPWWGRLSDRIGRRPVMLTSVFGVCLSYVLFSFSRSLAFLFLARGAAGFFSANISVAQAYVADTTPKEKRSVAMGMIGAAFGVGFICGPLIGAAMAPIGIKLGSSPPFGHQFVSLVAAGLGAINFILALIFLPETRPKNKNSKVLEPRKQFFSSFRKVLGMETVRELIVFFFLTSLAMALMEVMLFVLVKDRFAWTFTDATKAFAYIGVIMVLVQGYFIRKWIPRFGEWKVLLCGGLLMGLGLVGISFSYSIALLAVVMTFLAVGNGCIRPPLMGLASSATDQEQQGMVMGVMQSMAAMGRILGPPLGGFLYDYLTRGAPFVVAGLMTFLGLIYLLKTKPNWANA